MTACVERECSAAQAHLNSMLWVDTIDVCNLKCPTCIRGLRGMPNSAKTLPLDKFEEITKKARREGYHQIGLFSWTEPFVNPKLHEYIAIVKKHDLFCMVSSNFSLRRIPGLERALRAGIDHLIVSVSGFDQEVYQINHVGGNLAYVKDNLQIVAKLKRDGEASTRIVLRFIEFEYNKAQNAKLAEYATDLGIEFETIEGGGGDPRVAPFIPQPEHYEGAIKRFRSERPHEGVGEVCNLMFGQTPVDADGNVYLCCAFPYYESFRIGSYLDLPQEEILLRRYSHPYCGQCTAPRRAATPDDCQALVEAVGYRMGQDVAEAPLPVAEPVSPAGDVVSPPAAEAVPPPAAEAAPLAGDVVSPPVDEAVPPVVEAVPPGADVVSPANECEATHVGPVRRVWRAVAPMPVRRALARL